MNKKIKISKKDQVKGFYKLLTSPFYVHCLPNDKYIVPKIALKLLKREKIKFRLIKNN